VDLEVLVFVEAVQRPAGNAGRVRAGIFGATPAGEPAWHRRERQRRQAARGVVALANARGALRRHHGGGMAPSGADKSPCWGCGKCGFATNWASRDRCHKCDAVAPTKARDRARELTRKRQTAKAQRDPAPRGGSSTSGGGTPGADSAQAVRQVKQQLDAERRKHAAESKKLKEELELARKGGAAAMVVDAGSEGEDDELGKAVAAARERLRKVKGAPEELRDLLEGGYEACVAKLQSKLEEAQAARRAANPLAKQMEGAEAFKVRMDKKLTDAKAELAEKEKEVLEAERLRDQQEAAVAEAEAAVAKAAQEVSSLAAKYASERTANAASAPNAAEGRANETAVPPGYVSVSFAEEKWQEREVAFNQQLEQLKAIIGTQQSSAAAGDGASVASDVGNPDELDDDKWSKVDKSRRSALLRKQRD